MLRGQAGVGLVEMVGRADDDGVDARVATKPGTKCAFSATMSTTPADRAAATTASASGKVLAIGFSRRIALPCSAASRACAS